MAEANRQWLLAARPKGMVKESDFRWNEAPVPEPGEGEVLVRVRYLSFDPAMRGWMEDRPSYIPPVEDRRADARGRDRRDRRARATPGFARATSCRALFGWQDYALANGGRSARA